MLALTACVVGCAAPAESTRRGTPPGSLESPGAAQRSRASGSVAGQRRALHDTGTELATTYAVTVVTDRSEHEVRRDFADARARLHELEKVLSEWQADSALSQLNRHGASRPVAVPDVLLEILSASLKVTRATGGAFDVTWFSLAQVWNRAIRAQVLPSDEEVQTALAAVGPEHVQITGNRVRLSPRTRIGLGGVAKGWIVDAVFLFLRARGYTDLLVNIGGDLRAGGRAQDGPHVLKLTDPFVADRFALEIEVYERAVATSGNAYRVAILEGVRCGHVIDPRSGRPATFEGSVTALAADAAMADALATACFVLGPTEGLALAQRTSGLEVIFVSRTRIESSLPGLSRDR